MCFKAEELPAFIEMFESVQPKIEAFPGCSKVELVQDKADPTIMMTLSEWESEDALNAYRHSELFAGTWAKTKIKFRAKPEAWSVDRIK